MKISELCIRRPVFATVLSLLLVLVGLVSYQRVPVREYPNIDPPVITVSTNYAGASAEIIESQVTQVLEESLAGIEGIDYITSTNRAESSQITINFRLERDPDAAAADVRDRVSRVRGKLPEEISEPVIQKVEADASPIIYLAFSSDRHSALEVTDYADRYVKDRLQNIAGVAAVNIFGERRYAMRLWIDPERLAGYRLTPQDVETALRRQNVEIPAGRIEGGAREFNVLSETDLRTREQFENLVLTDAGGYLVRFRDVGSVEIGARDTRRVVRFRGQSAVALGIVKQATANPLEVSQALREEIPNIRQDLPEGMQVEVAYDKALFIEESLKNVYKTIAEAVVLVILIIFLFLRSIRATLIPMVTIPVSLIGVFALMYAFGFSLNTLTLLSLVLAIGLVVDDAIVMLENIYRHVEAGEPPLQAALKGSREIGFAVVAMTLTLAAVYAPVGFMSGKTGRLFTEFAWVLAGAVIVSGIVALTLSPMMCAKLLRHQQRHGVVYRVIESALDALSRGYRRVLGGALRVRWLVVAIAVAVLPSCYFLFKSLNSELAPLEDQGLTRVFVMAPEGATIDYTSRYTQQIEEIVRGVPEVERYFVVAGFPTVSQGIAFVRLKDWEDRERPQQAVTQEIAKKLFAIPGVLAFAANPPPLGQNSRSRPVQMVVQTSRPYEELDGMVQSLLAELSGYPGLSNVRTDLDLNKPQLKISMDRDKMAALGLQPEVVGRTLETLFGGRDVTRFKQAGKQYDVVLQVRDVDRSRPADLSRVYVRGGGGEPVQLANIITVTETVAPKELNHFNQMRSATIEANVGDGYTLGQALDHLEATARRVLPADTRLDYSGESRDFKESSASLYVTFLLALGFIYLVLAAQFESFVDPLVIMLTVPLAMLGALLGLKLTGGTLNIFSQVGMITLVGLITKHGILIVEFAHQLRERGIQKLEAVKEASVMRLRPILMTTGAMALGAVPLAIAFGAGAESRRQIGVVIVGGMLLGTFFTLFVIPVMYTLLSRERGGAGAR